MLSPIAKFEFNESVFVVDWDFEFEEKHIAWDIEMEEKYITLTDDVNEDDTAEITNILSSIGETSVNSDSSKEEILEILRKTGINKKLSCNGINTELVKPKPKCKFPVKPLNSLSKIPKKKMEFF